MSRYVYTEVEVNLGDFDTKDLIEELQDREAMPSEGSFDAKELVDFYSKVGFKEHDVCMRLDLN